MEEPYLKTIISDDIMYYDDYSMKSSASDDYFQKILKEPYPKIEFQQKYFV